MTQKELAKLVGVSRQTINAIEGVKYSPSLEVAFRIAHAFGTSIEDVFFYEPDIGGELPDNVIIEVSWDEDEDNDGNL